MHEFVTLADVVNGRLVLQDEDSYRDFVRRLTGRQEIRIGPPKKRGQSDKLRAYYHSVVVPAAMTYTGYDHDEQHELLKAMHLDKEDAREGRNGQLLQATDGRYYVIGGSTRREKLPTEKYWYYIERCRNWIAEQFSTPERSVYVPDPDPGWREKKSQAGSRRYAGDWDTEGVEAN